MVKTTVYLPEHSKQALARLARSSGRSEAELIREAIARLIEAKQAVRPRVPLFSSGQPELAERADELLQGFGE